MDRFCCDNSSNKISTIPSENLEQIHLLQYGERLQYDRTFKGPLSKRSCTDMFCLFLFVVFLIAWAYIGNYAIQNGDLNKLLVPTDSLNRKCGVDGHVIDKKFLFFFNLEKCVDPLVPITGCTTPQVCVSSCPTQTFVWDTMKNSLSLKELKTRLICQSENDKNSITSITDAEIAMNENRCARWYVQSKPFLNRCLWTFSPDRCEYIPSFLRSLKQRVISTYLPQTTATYSSFVLFPSNENAESEGVTKDRTAQTYENLKEAKEPTLQCSTRQKLGESIIKEKMTKANSFLSKLVGNFVSHFCSGLEAQQVGEQIVEDIINTRLIIILTLGIVIVISLIFISLMRWMAAPIVWFSILGVLFGLCFGVYYSITQYNYWKERPTVLYHSLNISSTLKNIFQQHTTWFYASVIMTIALSVIFLLLVVIRKRIRIAIALVKEGSKAVSCIVSTAFFPMFPWVLYMFSITLALGIGLYLRSVGDSTFKMTKLTPSEEICICKGPGINYTLGSQCNPNVFEENCFVQPINPTIRNLLLPKKKCIDTGCYFEGFGHSKIVTFFQVYNVVGFLWLSFFISALGDMVLAVTFASWYWTYRKSNVPYFVLSNAFVKVIRYHLGTLAFGAFMITICRVLCIVLEFIDHKLKKFDNSVTRGILCCMKCFFWALENFLRFINRNAYIMCAIHGKNFCESAKDSFNLLMRNFLRVIAVDKITEFLFFLSKLLLTGTTGIGTYYYFVANPDMHRLNYIGVPITLVVIGTYLITSVFFGVYSMAVDTLFLCFLEDCERNDGSEEKPYFMSKQLMEILQKRNKMQKK